MSVGPQEREVRSVREVLRGLSSARQVYALYPRGHPKRSEASRGVCEAIVRLREASPADPVIFASHGNFYLGTTLLAWESLTHHRLAEAMDEAGVRSIELLPNPSADDVDGLVRLLVGESVARDALGSVALNRAGLAPPEPQEGMGELLRGYASGLELLRRTAMRLLAGRPADLDATVRLTEQLADLIAGNPAEALLLTAVKSYDEFTYHHMVNVCILSLAIARAVGLPRERAIALGIGGLLHDVGKVRIPREILAHDGVLDEEQWRLIQRHPVDGAGLVIVTTRDPYHPAVAAILEHHVAFDASGYPALSGGRGPSPAARAVAVVDTFDAVTSKRSYRTAVDRRQALSLLQAGAGRAYDPRFVRVFIRLMGLFPIGSLVQLSTGEVGLVVRNHERLLFRPLVRLVLDASGSPCEPEERDLSETRDGAYRWSVVRSLDPEEIGLDLLSLLAAGRMDLPAPEATGPGLVHEPSPLEEPPEGYVDAHGLPEDPSGLGA